MNQAQAGRSITQLTELTVYIDRLSAKFPLCAHKSLRSQMRRSALDALSHAACAGEAVAQPDFRRLSARTTGALTELETFVRMAAKSRAVTPTEEAQILLMSGKAAHSVRLSVTAAGDELTEWAQRRSLTVQPTSPAERASAGTCVGVA